MTPRSFRARFGLKGKAFAVLLALLATVHLTVGVLGYRELVAASERELQLRMAAYPGVFEELLAGSADSLANVAAVLASSIRQDAAGVQEAQALPPQVGANLVGAQYYGADGRLLGQWDLPTPPALESATARAALAEVRRSHHPETRVVCDTECLQLVYVPVFGEDGRELVIALAAPLADVLPAFHRLTGAYVGILAAPGQPGAGNGLGEVDGRQVLALTDAASLLPRLQLALRPGRAGDAELLLHRAPLPGIAAGQEVQSLFIADRAETLRRIQQAFWRSIRLALGGLLLSVIVLYLLLSPPLTRLKHVTNLLPLLAERRFDEVRGSLSQTRRSLLPDEIDALHATAQALTERLQKLDTAEAASEAKSRFLAVMSHEIRTPMNGVVGMLELLDRSQLDSSQRDMLHVIGDSSQALLRVIDDILDFSKVEAGRIELEQLPFSLPDVVEGVLETLAPGARGRELRLLSYVDPTLPRRLLGDPVRLRQILFNLVGNAVKFTEQGRVVVRAERRPAPRGRVGLLLSIEDSGIGISEEAQQRLFQPFMQAESSTTRRYGGTGLGLSIARGLVTLMGGKLQLRSAPGQGSCFSFELQLEARPDTVELPVARLAEVGLQLQLDDPAEAAILRDYAEAEGAVPEGGRHGPLLLQLTEAAHAGAQRPMLAALRIVGPGGVEQLLRRPYRHAQLSQALAVAAGRALAPVAAAVPKAMAAVPASGLRLLVAEDHPTNQQVIVAQLARLGHAADIAEDGEVALQMLASQPYAALLTDIHMPRMDGYTLARCQREREAAGAPRLPIIALTANVLQGQVQRCLDAGIDDCLSKPVALEELRLRLQAWLGTAAAPPPAAAGTETPPQEAGVPIDLELLRECFGDDPQAIRQLLEDFLRINTPLMGQLQELLRNGAPADIGALAHRLLGSARTAGANGLAGVLACIEASSGANRELLSELWTQAAREYALVRDWAGRFTQQAAG
ncbi:MAG TPA: ATP-binding protein [Solimonas sp.]|nr:ATP-binding protein [Solimonas sp.]